MSEADPASGASFACCSSLCSMYCAVLYAARRLVLRYVPCTAQSFCTIHNVCIRVEVKCKPHSPLPRAEVPSKAGLPSVLEARHRLSLELFLLERAASSEYTVAIDDCMQRHRLQCVCVCVYTVHTVSGHSHAHTETQAHRHTGTQTYGHMHTIVVPCAESHGEPSALLGVQARPLPDQHVRAQGRAASPAVDGGCTC